MSNLPDTIARAYGSPDHMRPHGRHALGRLGDRVWHGTSRIVDPAGRARANRRTWTNTMAAARRDVVARRRALAALDAMERE